MNEQMTTICRVCLKCDSKFRRKFISIFKKHNDYLISETINSIANVKINQGDGLPTTICSHCLRELDAAIDFKVKCESSNTLLKTTLKYSKKPIENLSINNDEIKVECDVIKKEEPEHSHYLEVDYLADNFDEVFHEDNEQCDERVDVPKDLQIIPKNEVEPAENESVPNETTEVLLERKSRSIDLKLQCNECGGFFKSKCKMRVHWKKVHLAESLVCLMCKRMFKSFRAFNRHKRVKTQSCQYSSKITIEGMGRSRVFYCKECTYSSKRIKDLITHLVIHSGDRPFACNLCHRAFGQLSALDGHKESAHKLYKYETTCQFCGKHLKGRRVIYKHLKTHSSETYQCDICKKSLKSKASLKTHIVRHTGVKSYTCEKCASPFYTLAELCNHRRMTHEKGQHTYKCDKCTYTTLRSETLKKHKARHTDTNLPCEVCGMFFEDAECLKVHQNRHFGERKFHCPHCEKKYMNRKALSHHVREIHKCRFLVKKPVKPEVKPIKQETDESPDPSLEPYGNVIVIEVPPIPVQ